MRVKDARAHEYRRTADVSSQQGCDEGGGSFRRAFDDVDVLVSDRYPDSGECGARIVPCRAPIGELYTWRQVRAWEKVSVSWGKGAKDRLSSGRMRWFFSLTGTSFDRSPDETCGFV